MPWPVKMVSSIDEIFAGIDRGECVVGWACHQDFVEKDGGPVTRHGVWVILPGGVKQWNPFDPYDVYLGMNGMRDQRWSVAGGWPNVSVTPSIDTGKRQPPKKDHHAKGWHGYITDGVVTDDVEGRTYDELGL